ncbi:MAG: chemotaxis protein CheV [Deltaproteobacteria bacterium HGW-Deltaproteobacteria-6]|nr:MAG: chemotaxis protein CheV [Deltaproteobacteria bacterium HGW-Deltaproteobacteria-6]
MAISDNKGILLETGTNELEIIEVFIDEVGGYRGYYGINVAKVIKIISLPAIIKPPNAAHFVSGMFNHCGNVIILIDMAIWLGRERREDVRPIAIITEFNRVTSAFLVSGITRIHRTSWANIKPLDSYMQNFCPAVTGYINLEDKNVLMLDLERAIGEINPDLAVPHLQPIENKKAVSESAADGIIYPIRVLHADDSGMIRRATREALESGGEFIVTSEVDGSVAWEYLMDTKRRAAEQNKPLTDFIDIILTDVEMPQMDGYHLCHKVKNDPVLKDLPVVLFSSLITDKLLHKGKAVHADAQLSKPNTTELIAKLKEIMMKK